MRKFYDRGRAFFGKLAKDEAGAAAVEYALLSALVGLAIVAAASGLGSAISSSLNSVSSKLIPATGPGGAG